MAKKKQSTAPKGIREKSITLGEETTGNFNTTKSPNPKSLLKLDHLRNLASSTSTPSSLSAFFGRQFAAASEALGCPPDPSLVSCSRCETILQPGLNCTIRIEKNRARVRLRNKKPQLQHCNAIQNNVVYKCHFCSHGNQKRGTLRGHMKEISPPAPKPSTPLKPTTCLQSTGNVGHMKDVLPLTTNSPTSLKPTLFVHSKSDDASVVPNDPMTPLEKMERANMNSKRKKRNRSSANNVADDKERNTALGGGESSNVASSKRRRKSNMSLRQIVESEERARMESISKFKLPSFI